MKDDSTPSSPLHSSSMISADVYLEQVAIPDGTPEEMAQSFVDIANAAYAETRMGMSKMHSKVMDVNLADIWKIEIGGKHFAMLQWRTYYPNEEE